MLQRFAKLFIVRSIELSTKVINSSAGSNAEVMM